MELSDWNWIDWFFGIVYVLIPIAFIVFLIWYLREFFVTGNEFIGEQIKVWSLLLILIVLVVALIHFW